MVLNKKLIIPSAREILRSLRTIREDWQLKTPYQKWGFFYGIGKAAVVITGVTIFKEDQTLPLLAYQICVCVGVYTVLALYTLYRHINEGAVTKCLPCTCLLSLLIAVSFCNSNHFFLYSKDKHYLIDNFAESNTLLFDNLQETIYYTQTPHL